jgi:hypothetical protein
MRLGTWPHVTKTTIYILCKDNTFTNTINHINKYLTFVQYVGIEPTLFLVGSQMHHHLCVYCVCRYNRIWTCDIFLIREVLYQTELYTYLVLPRGFEPRTFPLKGGSSNQTELREQMWRRRESNPQGLQCKCKCLANTTQPHKKTSTISRGGL